MPLPCSAARRGKVWLRRLSTVKIDCRGLVAVKFGHQADILCLPAICSAQAHFWKTPFGCKLKLKRGKTVFFYRFPGNEAGWLEGNHCHDCDARTDRWEVQVLWRWAQKWTLHGNHHKEKGDVPCHDWSAEDSHSAKTMGQVRRKAQEEESGWCGWGVPGKSECCWSRSKC